METLDRKALRLMIMEALAEMKQCSECGSMYESGSDHECGAYENDDLDEFSGGSGAGAVAGYTLPLGMRPSGPRRDTVNVARRSFGGLGKNRKKRKKR